MRYINMIAMEDNFADVIGKAQRGLGLSDAALLARAGISQKEFDALRAEIWNRAALEKMAPALGLNASALAGLPQYRPSAPSLAGLAVFNTPYRGMRVNAFVVWDGPDAAIFDTGADAEPILAHLRAYSLRVGGIFLTHAHGDHIACLETLQHVVKAPVWISSREPIPDPARGFDAGRAFECGRLRIETRQTWGHSRGGVTYVVHGLERPVAVVGDALFAGSMGGGMISYADALRTNREAIFTLPPETVICPGHGPLTTVEQERVHNPFFA